MLQRTGAGVVRISEYMECRGVGACYSALMLAARITLPHLSVYSTMNLPKSAGIIGIGTLPRSAIRLLILGSSRPALISLLSLSMISAGVFLGAPRPDHVFPS